MVVLRPQASLRASPCTRVPRCAAGDLLHQGGGAAGSHRAGASLMPAPQGHGRRAASEPGTGELAVTHACSQYVPTEGPGTESVGIAQLSHCQ